MKILIVAIAIALSGCATSKTIAVGPSGKPMHFITCGSAGLQFCYEKAAEVCPGGYQFVDHQNSQNAGFFSPQRGVAFAMMGPQTMAVECK